MDSWVVEGEMLGTDRKRVRLMVEYDIAPLMVLE